MSFQGSAWVDFKYQAAGQRQGQELGAAAAHGSLLWWLLNTARAESCYLTQRWDTTDNTWHLTSLTASIPLAPTELPAACLISNLGEDGLLRQPCPLPAWCSQCCWGVLRSVPRSASRAAACFAACTYTVINTHWLTCHLLALEGQDMQNQCQGTCESLRF